MFSERNVWRPFFGTRLRESLRWSACLRLRATLLRAYAVAVSLSAHERTSARRAAPRRRALLLAYTLRALPARHCRRAAVG